MKKTYTTIFLTMILSLFICRSEAVAQTQWNTHSSNRSEVPQKEGEAETEEAGKIYIGHCSYNDEIWPQDGLSLDFDSRVGVGIKIPRSMIKDYVGGKIVAVRAGWDDEASNGFYECFVRTESFNGENLATGSGEVTYGWNEIRMKKSISLPLADALYVGFYTNLKKGVCSIPFVYPYVNYDTTNCCYLYVDGDNDSNGNENWLNMSSQMQPMAIVLVIEDTEGKFKNIVVFNDLRADVVTTKDATGTGEITITNKGTNEISSLEITTTFGDQSSSQEITLSNAIQQEKKASLSVPVHCFGSGEHTVSISKINGEAPKETYEGKINLIGVPEDVAANYTFRPVVQFFGSEDEYRIPTYFDEIFWPGYELFKDEMTLICPHVDDKFQTGNNEALEEMIELCGQDKMKVYIPATTINRSDYVQCLVPLDATPFQFGIMMPDAIVPLYEDVLTYPTFASVNIETSYNEETKEATVDVYGDVAEGIMPTDEPLYLTVYLMEKDVESWDQMFWEDKPGEVPDPKLYVHKNVIREILTPYWGEELKMTDNEFAHNFVVDVDYEEYNGENLYIAAFVNRGQANHHMQRQIINSNEKSLNIPSSVIEINSDKTEFAVKNIGGQIFVNGEAAQLYNLAGSRIANNNVAPGIYIVKAICNGETVARKLVVK